MPIRRNFSKRVHYIDRRIPTARELAEASQRIKASKRPVIIVGGGCKYSEAGEILEQISRDCQIPLVETHAGKSTVSWDFKTISAEWGFWELRLLIKLCSKRI